MEVALPEAISKTGLGYFQTEDILKYIIPKVSEMSLLLKEHLLAAYGASLHSNGTPTIARQNLGCNSTPTIAEQEIAAHLTCGAHLRTFLFPRAISTNPIANFQGI